MRYVKLHHDRLQGLKGKQVPEGVKVCLVLGAKLRPDNSLSPILQLRVRMVSILANAYPDWTFYISGCRADTTVIYRTLVEEYHIPEERFVLDSCGYNTFRSLWDMNLFFQQTRFYILTSSFHIARSVRIARWLGYDAWGIDISDYEKVKSLEGIRVIGHITKPELGCQLVTRDGQEFELKAQGWNHCEN